MDVYAAGLPDPAGLVFTALILTAVSGLPGLFLRNIPGLGQKIATITLGVGSLLGLFGAVSTLCLGRTETFTLGWTLPFGSCDVSLDPLSAFFLIPVFLVPACAAVYANGYWPARTNPSTEPAISFFFGLLAASMGALLVARNGVLFLLAWEVMALSAYFPMVADHGDREVRKAGTVYLVATHTGTMALFVMFSLLRATTSSFLFPAAGALSTAAVPATAIFLCALLGFGVKAGIMPLHLWLPAAHANGPSHISAIMSGVMLKMGIYGIIRVISFFHAPPLWWGVVLLTAGSASALLGVVFAIAQHDIKKLLAYSSIENIGIITMGLGVSLIGAASHNPALATLGMAGALLHILNHSLFKPLLFLGAGTLIHGTGTRMIDRMGGLASRMPATSLFFLAGTVAICGLPPLNGFVSEFLLYIGFFSEARTAAVPFLAMGAPLLGLIGGLAVICFIKLYGTVFLGLPRTEAARKAHEGSRAMLFPMGVLGLLCVAAGLLPSLLIGMLRGALPIWQPDAGQAADGFAVLPRLDSITYAGVALLAAAVILAAIFRLRLKAAPSAQSSTWGCGYLAPAASIQYTSSSFGDTAVTMFKGIIRPAARKKGDDAFFPGEAAFSSRAPETLLEQIVLPSFRVTGGVCSFLRILQMGKVHIYMLYIFIVLVLLLICAY